VSKKCSIVISSFPQGYLAAAEKCKKQNGGLGGLGGLKTTLPRFHKKTKIFTNPLEVK
jgi:hypothetical protein